MIRSICLMATLLAITLCFGTALADDAQRGRVLSKSCRCHGDSLNGMSKDELVKKLVDYKNGQGKSKSMIRKAQSLTDQDIRDLATYYSGLKT